MIGNDGSGRIRGLGSGALDAPAAPVPEQGGRSVSLGQARGRRAEKSMLGYVDKKTDLMARNAEVGVPNGGRLVKGSGSSESSVGKTPASIDAGVVIGKLNSLNISPAAKVALGDGLTNLFSAGKLASRAVYGDEGLEKSLKGAGASINELEKGIRLISAEIIMESFLVGEGDQELVALLESIKAEMEGMCADLTAKKEEWRAQVDAHPRGAKSTKVFMDKFTKAGIVLLDHKLEVLSVALKSVNSHKKQHKLEKKIDALKQARAELEQLKPQLPESGHAMSPTEFKAAVNKHRAIVKSIVKEVGVSKKAFKAGFQDVLNKSGNIDTIQSRVTFFHNGEASTFECSTNPASRMPELADSYISTGHTYVSSLATKEATHAVNLNVSSMKDDEGKTVLSQVRAGACSAYGIESKKKRAKAGEARAKEVITASFATALEKNPELKRAVEDAMESGQPVDFTHVSVTMLNPGRVMSVLRKLISVVAFFSSFAKKSMRKLDERGQLNDHLKAMRAMEKLGAAGNLEIPVKMGDGKIVMVKVKPKVISLNFPTHARASGGFKKLAYVGTNVLENNRSMNARSLKTLVGDLKPGSEIGGLMGERLAAGGLSDAEMAEIQQLSEQVRQIWTSKSYRDMSDDPFQMVARLTNLAGMAGNTGVAFHCSSGKDRTGACDAESKFLKQSALASGGVVPAPGYEVQGNEEDRGNYQTAMLATHQDTVQERCTGIAGSKTKGLEGLEVRMDPEARSQQIGGQNATKV